jgi:hypothetical protein
VQRFIWMRRTLPVPFWRQTQDFLPDLLMVPGMHWIFVDFRLFLPRGETLLHRLLAASLPLQKHRL